MIQLQPGEKRFPGVQLSQGDCPLTPVLPGQPLPHPTVLCLLASQSPLPPCLLGSPISGSSSGWENPLPTGSVGLIFLSQGAWPGLPTLSTEPAPYTTAANTSVAPAPEDRSQRAGVDLMPQGLPRMGIA